jgi:hypothetical protein
MGLFSCCLALILANASGSALPLPDELCKRVFQQAVLLYGTTSKNGRGELVVKRLHWPIVLSLLLGSLLGSFASYMVLAKEERNHRV